MRTLLLVLASLSAPSLSGDHPSFERVLVDADGPRNPWIKIVGDFAWEYARRHHLTEEDFDRFQSSEHTGKIRRLQRLQRFYVGRCDRVLVPSEYLRGIVGGWGIPSERSFICSRWALSCQRWSVGSQQKNWCRGQFSGWTCSVAVSCRTDSGSGYICGIVSSPS